MYYIKLNLLNNLLDNYLTSTYNKEYNDKIYFSFV